MLSARPEIRRKPASSPARRRSSGPRQFEVLAHGREARRRRKPVLSIIDEYHEHLTSEQVDTMVSGMGAREQPLCSSSRRPARTRRALPR